MLAQRYIKPCNHNQSHSKGMSKYTLHKDKSDGYGGNIPDIKVVSKKVELKECLKKEWYVVKKYTPIISPIKNWWYNFTTDQKIAIYFGIIMCVITVFFGVLA